MAETTVLAFAAHRCEHHCPICDAMKPHQATVSRPCIFLRNRICDDCVREQLRLAETEHS